MVVHTFAGLIVFLMLVSGFREAFQVFESQGFVIPEITISVAKWMQWVNNYWLLVIPGTLLIDSLVLIALELLPRGYRWLARVWFSGVLIAALLAAATIYGATLPPIILLPDTIDEMTSRNSAEALAPSVPAETGTAPQR